MIFNNLLRAGGVSAIPTAVALVLGVSIAQAQEIELPLATWGSPDHISSREFIPALERALEDRQPHKLKLRVFPGGQIGQDKDMPVAIPSGQVKFALITVAGWSGTVPDTKVFDAPLGLSMDQFDLLIHREDGVLEALQEAFLAKNSVLLAVVDLGPPVIVSKGALTSPEDLKGKKIRVFSAGTGNTISALGGSPVSVAFAEVYTAMQYGTIDAAVIGLQGVKSQKMNEVADHVLLPGSFLGTAVLGWAANKQWIESIPDAERAIFLESVEAAAKHTQAAIRAEIDDLKTSYRESGMVLTTLSSEMPEYREWRALVDPLQIQALQQLGQSVSHPVSEALANTQ